MNRAMAEECCTPYTCETCGVVCKGKWQLSTHQFTHFVPPPEPTEEEVEAEHAAFAAKISEMDFENLWKTLLLEADDDSGIYETRRMASLKAEFKKRLEKK
jgi:hypothetical protein